MVSGYFVRFKFSLAIRNIVNIFLRDYILGYTRFAIFLPIRIIPPDETRRCRRHPDWNPAEQNLHGHERGCQAIRRSQSMQPRTGFHGHEPGRCGCHVHSVLGRGPLFCCSVENAGCSDKGAVPCMEEEAGNSCGLPIGKGTCHSGDSEGGSWKSWNQHTHIEEQVEIVGKLVDWSLLVCVSKYVIPYFLARGNIGSSGGIISKIRSLYLTTQTTAS